jgi:hypothetical protein
MILHWLNPLALAGLVITALPVVIHLLKRHRALRVPFPTLRFLTDSRAAAVRVRTLSDPLLLTVRVATIAAAVLAAAQPEIITSWQRRRHDQQIARAIVVDTSASTTSLTRKRAEAVEAERRADAVVEVGAVRPGASLCQAAAGLLNGPVARHEIVVISDFQHGSVTDADIACVPPDVGLRFVQIGDSRPGRTSATLVGLAADGKATQQQVEFDGPRTRVTVLPIVANAASEPKILAPSADAAAVAQLLRAVARIGAPSLPAERPLTFAFSGVTPPATSAPRSPWMIASLVAAGEDRALREAAASRPAAKIPALPAVWVPVLRSVAGEALVSAAAEGRGLMVLVAAGPSDVLSVAAARAFLTAVATAPDWRELEVETISPAQLKAWTRAAASIPPDRFKPTAPGDARWLWALALALICVEWLVRRERPIAPETEARAA